MKLAKEVKFHLSKCFWSFLWRAISAFSLRERPSISSQEHQLLVMSQHINDITVLPKKCYILRCVKCPPCHCQKFIIPLMCFETKDEQQSDVPDSSAVIQSCSLSLNLLFQVRLFIQNVISTLCTYYHGIYSTLCISLIAQFSHNSFHANAISVSLSLVVLSFSLSSEAGDVTVGL